MSTTDQEFIGPRERFTVLEITDYDDGWGVKTILCIRAYNGLFVSAVGNGRLAPVSHNRGPDETFIFGPSARADRSWWIQTIKGKKWSVEPGGGEFLLADRDQAGNWETYWMAGKPIVF